MPPGDRALFGAPERVVRFQSAYSAPSRAAILRLLLKGPMSYDAIFDAVGDALVRSSVHVALRELAALGYVSDDAPPGALRKPQATTFTADRQLIAEDWAATHVYLFA